MPPDPASTEPTEFAPRPALRIAGFARTFGRNPYPSLVYGHLGDLGFELVTAPRFEIGWLWRARHRVNVLHFGWSPNDYYDWTRSRGRPRRVLTWLRVSAFAARLLAARALGFAIAWTIHEIYPPNSSAGRRLDRLAGRLLARASHVLIAHDPAVAARARAEFGRVAEKIDVVRHGSYAGVYPQGRSPRAVRDELGIAPDAFVFLCFGRLRRDKGIELLLEAFRALPGRHAVLIVAGLVEHDEVGFNVAQAAASDSRVIPLLEFVADDRVAELFGAADAAVLARSEVWTSGSLILALTLGLPAVAAKLPPHEELLGRERAGWLFEPGDVRSLRGALERAMADPARPRKRAAALEQAAGLPPWSDVAQGITTLMTDAGPMRGESTRR